MNQKADLVRIAAKIKAAWFQSSYIKRKRQVYMESVRNRYNYDILPSIICSNCIGGMIYHNLGLRFLSPTINLWMLDTDLVKLVANLADYMNIEVEDHGLYDGYPTGKLGDIILYFNHYATFEEAKRKWDERKKRIRYDQLYVMLGDNGLGYEEIKNLKTLPCKQLVVFTAKDYPDVPYTYQLKKYQNNTHVGKYTTKYLNGFMEFEKSFDYVKWFNETSFSKHNG